MNIDTNIREAFVKGVREIIYQDPNEIDIRKSLSPAKKAITGIIRGKSGCLEVQAKPKEERAGCPALSFL